MSKKYKINIFLGITDENGKSGTASLILEFPPNLTAKMKNLLSSPDLLFLLYENAQKEYVEVTEKSK